MDTMAIVYKALFGPRFRVCKDCFDSLSDRRVMYPISYKLVHAVVLSNDSLYVFVFGIY